MKAFVALFLIAVVAAAPAPQNPNDQVQVVLNYNDNIGDGNYRFAFEQTDGTLHEARGELKPEGPEGTQVVRGIFSWIAPTGVRYVVTYTADERGYQPEVEEQPPGAPLGISGAAVASALG